ncbi:MAG TPA: hypothetical protein DHW82_04580 [Spirochaetia bacterium]|nr:hypothetical protein [Spirochaetia bacterium]
MQTHAHFLSQKLSEKSYEIQVLTYRFEDIENDRFYPFPVLRILSRLSFWNNISIIKKAAFDFNPDLIYSSTVFYGILEKELKIPVICRSVGNDVLRPWISYPFKWGKKILNLKLIEKKIYRLSKKLNHPEWVENFFIKSRFEVMRQSALNASHILANSHYTASLLEKIGVLKENIQTLPGGVDYKQFKNPYLNNSQRIKDLRIKLKIPENRLIFLTPCRMVKKKGVDFALNTAKKLKKILPQVFFLFLGDGKYQDQYIKKSLHLSLSDTVCFTGRIPFEKLNEYYWASDFLFFPSREEIHPKTGLKDVETMGRVLCEANAASLPVISSRTGGTPSIIEHGINGLLFEPENFDDFYTQLKRFLDSPQEKETMTKEGILRAKNFFDWDFIVQHHEKVFLSLIEK